MDNITSLLEKVASGAVSVKDAREALTASNSRRRRWIAPGPKACSTLSHPGRSSVQASGGASYLVTLLMVWGMFGHLLAWDDALWALHEVGPTTTRLPSSLRRS